jgi:hypothetical protein
MKSSTPPSSSPITRIGITLSALVVVAAASSGACAAPVEEEAPQEEVAESDLTGQQACQLIAGASAGLGAIATQAFFGTAACAGAMAVTVGGELVCLAPAAGASLTAIGAVLTGGASYLMCTSSSGNTQRVPLTSTGSPTCSTTSATTAPNFCSNLYRRYKQSCGKLDLSRPERSETSCRDINIATARDNGTCTTLSNRVERNAQCLHGRRIMQDFVRRGICQGDPTDPDGTNHEKPIQVANDLLAECKSKLKSLNNLCQKDPEELQRSSVRRFNQAVYTCK